MSDNSFKIKHSALFTPKNLAELVNPEAGEIACDINDNNKIKRYDASASAWVEVGSGGGALNYIDNDDFEAGTTGYATYKDAADAVPVDGTGGTAAVTITNPNTNPLRGVRSGLITKGAANLRGEGVGYNFSIDPADQAKVLRVSFDYESSANYADGDIRVYVYDVTNSQLIEVIDRDLYASAQGRYLGTFQTSSNSTSYRLIFHVASINALAYTVKIDSVFVGEQTIVKGPIVSNWIEFQPTIQNLSGFSNIVGFYRRVGDSAEIRYNFTKNATNGTSASAVTFDLPTGLVLDANKLVTNFASIGGVAYYRLGGLNNVEAAVNVRPDTGITIREAGATTVLVGTDITASTALGLFVTVPILGWSSNVTLSEDAGNREIAFRAGRVNAATFTSPITAVFPDVNFDTTNSYNSSTGIYTVPESGKWDVNFNLVVLTGSTAPTRLQAYIQIPGASGLLGTRINDLIASKEYTLNGSGTFELSKGTEVKVIIESTGNSSSTVTGSTIHSFSVSKRSSPQTIAASEVVAARYTSTSGQNYIDNTVLIFENLIYDTHNAYNISTGSWTCPQTGYYNFNAVIETQAVAAGSATQYSGLTVRNLTTDAVIESRNLARITTSQNHYASINVTLYCVKGHVFQIRPVETIPAVTLSTSERRNHMSITKINGVS